MAVNVEQFQQILTGLGDKARLIAVSKTKPVEDIQALYDLGQRDFGENYVQELVDKQGQLPSDIRWHFIGHLQSNKVKYIAPFVHLIHGVDSLRLLKEIDKQAARNGRSISCLLQVYIAREETKFGLDEAELAEVIKTLAIGPASSGSPSFGAGELSNVNVLGLMGMASFTEDPEKIRAEFHTLKLLFDHYFGPAATSTARAASSTSDLTGEARTTAAPILSMGMSGDYQLAIAEGSNMVRIGSLLFGKRG
jgi:pyridoxal phosphate enzyme (YggS family)